MQTYLVTSLCSQADCSYPVKADIFHVTNQIISIKWDIGCILDLKIPYCLVTLLIEIGDFTAFAQTIPYFRWFQRGASLAYACLPLIL